MRTIARAYQDRSLQVRLPLLHVACKLPGNPCGTSLFIFTPALHIAAACLAITIGLRYWALFRQDSLNARKLGHAICTNTAFCILQSCFVL